MTLLTRLNIVQRISRLYRSIHLFRNQYILENKLSNKVYLRNFWGKLEELDCTKRFLINLMIECAPSYSKVRVDSVFPDFSARLNRILSLIQDHKSEGTKELRVWYSGENVRPPNSQGIDAFLGFDKNSPIASNVFLPLWATQLGEDVELARHKQEVLMSSRRTQFKKKDFACIVISNPEPIRLHFLAELQKIGSVHCYGPAFGNTVLDKQEVLQRYRFNLCFENDLYPNYVTEKVFNSYEGECIPIWWGLDDEGFLNDGAIINVHKIGFRESLEKIHYLEGMPLEQDAMREQPILKKGYDFNALIHTLKLNLHKDA